MKKNNKKDENGTKDNHLPSDEIDNNDVNPSSRSKTDPNCDTKKNICEYYKNKSPGIKGVKKDELDTIDADGMYLSPEKELADLEYNKYFFFVKKILGEKV